MYENMTYENIKDNILSQIQGIDKQEGSFVNDMVSPISLEIEGNYVELNKILYSFFLEDATSTNLEKRCSEYGIYRKMGTVAEGTITITGLENTVISKDTLLSTSTGLSFTTIEEKNISSNGTIDVKIKATDVGAKYNVEANTINTLSVGITGVTGVTNKEKLTGGTDIETDEELLNRLLLRLRTPATSGNKEHYRLWAMEVDGIGDAMIFPLWNGNGTVQVLPITTTDKKAPDEKILNKVMWNIEEKRPLGATVTVIAPTEIKINIDATIEIDTNYELEKIINSYTEKISKYIKDSVPKIKIVDYFKCLSIFYEVEGVKAVKDFKINNNATNISIGKKEIQVIGTINIA